jgi:hypothetical protein
MKTVLEKTTESSPTVDGIGHVLLAQYKAKSEKI